MKGKGRRSSTPATDGIGDERERTKEASARDFGHFHIDQLSAHTTMWKPNFWDKLKGDC